MRTAREHDLNSGVLLHPVNEQSQKSFAGCGVCLSIVQCGMRYTAPKMRPRLPISRKPPADIVPFGEPAACARNFNRSPIVLNKSR